MGHTSSISVALTAKEDTTQDIGIASYAITDSAVVANFSAGSGLNQANYVWADRRTLLASASEVINMSAPVPQDALGQVLNLLKIKALYIFNYGGATAAPADIIKVGGEGSSDCWNSIFDGSDTAKLSLQPGGALVLTAPSAAGYAVTNPGNYKLKIENTNGAQAVDYKIIVIGA